MHTLERQNDGYRHTLACAGVLTCCASAVPVRSNKAKEVNAAIRGFTHLATPRNPAHLQTDERTEFMDRKAKALPAPQHAELFQRRLK
jgi:hypothetical protein